MAGPIWSSIVVSLMNLLKPWDAPESLDVVKYETRRFTL
jgi:hypothetical protein